MPGHRAPDQPHHVPHRPARDLPRDQPADRAQPDPVEAARLPGRAGPPHGRAPRGVVSRLVDELLEAGLVFEGAKGESRRGRKPMHLHIETRRRCVAAVDVSASRTAMMVTDLLGHPLLDVVEFPTRRRPAAPRQGRGRRPLAAPRGPPGARPVRRRRGVGVGPRRRRGAPQVLPHPGLARGGPPRAAAGGDRAARWWSRTRPRPACSARCGRCGATPRWTARSRSSTSRTGSGWGSPSTGSSSGGRTTRPASSGTSPSTCTAPAARAGSGAAGRPTSRSGR